MNKLFNKLATSFIVVATSFFFTASAVLAASGLPMLSTSVATGAEYADRLISGNGVNGSPVLVAQALHYTGRISQPSVQEAAEYLRNTEVSACPQGSRQLSTVLGDSLGQVSRAYRSDEMCLWDRNTGQVVASASCGNVDLERATAATPLVAERAEQGPSGPQNERGLRGYPGEQGPPGRDGRDGYVVLQEDIQILGYDQGTPERMSDMARVQITGQVFETIQTGIVVAGISRLGSRYIDGQVRREQIRANAQVTSAYWYSQQGPSHVSVVGNCNGVLGGNANCQTTTTTNTTQPAQVVREYVDRDRPIYVDRPVLVPIPGTGGGPVYTPPAEPMNRPSYTPPAEPVFGGGLGYNQPAGPIGGGGLSDPAGNPSYTQPVEPIYNQPAGPQCSAPPC